MATATSEAGRPSTVGGEVVVADAAQVVAKTVAEFPAQPAAAEPAAPVPPSRPPSRLPVAPAAAPRSPSEPPLPRSSLIVWIVSAALLLLLAWAWRFELDEVSTGTGKVVPSSKEQMVQSLEGGILVDLKVAEGDIVEEGQVLAQLDRTKTESTVQESASRVRAALAMSARLTAEVGGTPLAFPPEVQADTDLVRTETALYRSRREQLSSSLAGVTQALALMRSELALTEPLVSRGAASDVEVLRLKRQINEAESKAADIRSQYYVKAREELARANAEIEAQRSVTRGRSDSLTRLTFASPVRGIVKDIAVTTVGGVLPPGGKLMEIVPLDEKLLVEARISPRDVAFIHPGQEATVKVTAYDYAIFGGLPGKVTTISPDTIQDDVRRDVYYYRVYIRTDADHLTNRSGKSFPIVPGMIASVDIHTGSKSVLDYLVKPLNKAREALRER
ncbi:HlyD family type I secretion periplasmic adaptor subunit [Variovorax atrisoli]|uniref:HlyD family type I secretion periplasmic adaptor subunit n=1 Tax=Variovorax atrisoli TaxID=3394203 RepID=UPI001812FFCB|nr:HlyD family type I secretion periplasmic adaptor subunit [Variovorax sp. BK613]MBB3639111.1 adhesin transport system membrane fusion protein [Variovorax sp. BK613]